ncbi:hypothetical protein FOA52_010322 [Chlamydomonas sp. UWO 241]|nr:hypothetical protein FOA52_010322 [Chlamydomonas sp. UWO 241]
MCSWPASVHEWADWGEVRGTPLHVLINNAGANFMSVQPWFTEEGVAGLPQVNFLGPLTLTWRLSGCLSKSAAASGQRSRIVNLCSLMHRHAQLPDDPNFFFTDWWVGGSYRNCKLALTCATALLQEQLGSAGVDVLSVDPGAVYSGIWATSEVWGRPPGSTLMRTLFATPDDACATTVHAAAAAEIVQGGYYARGLFSRPPIVGGASEPVAGAVSLFDWPLRSLGAWIGGGPAARIACVPVAPLAEEPCLAPARALWDAAREKATRPPAGTQV